MEAIERRSSSVADGVANSRHLLLFIASPNEVTILMDTFQAHGHDVRIASTIDQALTVYGAGPQVDAVLARTTLMAAAAEHEIERLRQMVVDARLVLLSDDDLLDAASLATRMGWLPATGPAVLERPVCMVGSSTATQELNRVLRRIAPLPSTVLIQGESGTGKEVAAQTLHQLSHRAAGPFVPVNCGAIPAELMESELFGHVKGAFTGAHDRRNGLFTQAQHGTLFLDEIGELPLPMQSKLLRVLEDHRLRQIGGERELPLDVRIIAASNCDLEKAVESGLFRADLYYRLNVVNLKIPPLRERREDIPDLAHLFSQLIAEQLGIECPDIPPQDMQMLMELPWPGNARELRNVIERWLIMGTWDLSPAEPDMPVFGIDMQLAEVEKQHILRVLDFAGGNRTRAASILGVSRRTLERKLACWRRD